MNLFVLILFVLLPLVGAILAVRTWLLLRHGVRVTANVVGREWLKPESDGETIELPIVVFRDERGRDVRITMTGEPPDSTAGGTVRLIYPRGRPKRARYANRTYLWLVPGLFFAPALAIIVLVGISVLYSRLFG